MSHNYYQLWFQGSTATGLVLPYTQLLFHNSTIFSALSLIHEIERYNQAY